MTERTVNVTIHARHVPTASGTPRLNSMGEADSVVSEWHAAPTDANTPAVLRSSRRPTRPLPLSEKLHVLGRRALFSHLPLKITFASPKVAYAVGAATRARIGERGSADSAVAALRHPRPGDAPPQHTCRVFSRASRALAIRAAYTSKCSDTRRAASPRPAIMPTFSVPGR